jgi:hypothetical protein
MDFFTKDLRYFGSTIHYIISETRTCNDLSLDVLYVISVTDNTNIFYDK